MSQPAPKLKRVLSRRDLVLYGLVILGPTAPYPVYGLVQQLSRGHAALGYLVAMVAVLFTAASYGKMSGAFPSAGSTYTYARRALNEHVGFLAGWAMILDYVLIPLVSMIYAALTAQRLLPAVPYAAWAIFSPVLLTMMNIPGIRVTARASEVMMALMTHLRGLFIVLAAKYVVAAHGWAGLFAQAAMFRPETFARPAVDAGGGHCGAVLHRLRCDLDTGRRYREPGAGDRLCHCARLRAADGDLLCHRLSRGAGLAGFHSFPDPDTMILDLAAGSAGTGCSAVVTFILLVAGLASALTGQAGASRLLYGMGRDGVLSRRIFAYIDPQLLNAHAQDLSAGRRAVLAPYSCAFSSRWNC